MINNNLVNHSPDEMILWVDNDQWLSKYWRQAIRTGNINYIKDAFDDAGFIYRDDQYDRLVEEFESELKQNEIALEECNIVRDMHGNVVEGA